MGLTSEHYARLTMAMTVLGEAFRQPITEQTVRAYEIGLEDVPIEAIEKAVRVAIQRSQFFPTCVELREFAGVARAEDQAIVAWNTFQRGAAHCRGHGYADFHDPCIRATVRSLGGWERIVPLAGDDFHVWLRKQFVETYSALSRIGFTAEQGETLVGPAVRERIERDGDRGGLTTIADAMEVVTGLDGESR